MDFLLAALFAVLCGALVYRMVRSRDVVDLQLGVVGVFSVGYFCLPVWFKNLSRLQFYSEDKVSEALLVFLLFLVCVVVGTWVGRLLVPVSCGFDSPNIDRRLFRHRRALTAVAFAAYVYYYSTSNVTAYSAPAQDFSAVFNGDSSSSSIPAVVANIALGWIAFQLALALRDRRKREAVIYVLYLGTCAVMLLFVGQRLAFLNPFVMLLAALALTGQAEKAVRMLVISVLALLLVSPVAVAVRQSPRTVDATQTVSAFSYGRSPLETVFQSIIDRGDLLYVSIRMIPRIDSDPLPGIQYYASVPLTVVPRALFPGQDKPFLLSTNGRPQGELSIYAWQEIQGNTTGSLSAFGGLVAYRELGWPGVILNGMAAGIFFVLLFRWLGRGGTLAMVIYSGLFVSLSVKKVPPSFWEAVGELMPLLPFLLLIGLAELTIARRKVQGSPVSVARSRSYER